MLGTNKIGDNESKLGLTEALHDLKSGGLFKLTVDLGIQCLARRCHMLDG